MGSNHHFPMSIFRIKTYPYDIASAMKLLTSYRGIIVPHSVYDPSLSIHHNVPNVP